MGRAGLGGGGGGSQRHDGEAELLRVARHVALHHSAGALQQRLARARAVVDGEVLPPVQLVQVAVRAAQAHEVCVHLFLFPHLDRLASTGSSLVAFFQSYKYALCKQKSTNVMHWLLANIKHVNVSIPSSVDRYDAISSGVIPRVAWKNLSK
jgi:hypothetical protein